MKLFRPKPEPKSEVPASVDPACWALPAPQDVVAEGFAGLRLSPDGQVLQVAQPGQKLGGAGGQPHAQRWWVRQGRWRFEFAPEPNLAPEAGLSVEIDAFEGASDYSFLATWLVGHVQPITAERLGVQMRAHPCIQTLPPCVSADQLAQRCRYLNSHAIRDWGFRVLTLQRVVLPAPPRPAIQPAPAPAGATGEHQPGRTEQAHPVKDSAALATELAWPAVVAADRKACRRLSRELPALHSRLRAAWTGEAWSAETAVAQQQRLLQRLGLLGDKFGVPVSIEQRVGARSALGSLERRLVAAAALRAEQALGDAWAVLEGLRMGQPPSAAELGVLERVVNRLELEVNRRLSAWWEIAE